MDAFMREETITMYDAYYTMHYSDEKSAESDPDAGYRR
jgi:hypothetical protein